MKNYGKKILFLLVLGVIGETQPIGVGYSSETNGGYLETGTNPGFVKNTAYLAPSYYVSQVNTKGRGRNYGRVRRVDEPRFYDNGGDLDGDGEITDINDANEMAIIQYDAGDTRFPDERIYEYQHRYEGTNPREDSSGYRGPLWGFGADNY